MTRRPMAHREPPLAYIAGRPVWEEDVRLALTRHERARLFLGYTAATLLMIGFVVLFAFAGAAG